MLKTIAVCVFGVCVASLGGCRVGQSMQGEPMVGVSLGEVEQGLADVADHAAQAVSAVGGFLPFPYDILAGGVAVILAETFGRNRGRRRGWEEREQQQSRIDLAWEESAARAHKRGAEN